MQADNYLTFTQRSPAELQAAYPGFVPTHDINSEITTQLPRKIVIIRSLVALGITLLAAVKIKTPFFRRAVLAVGLHFFVVKTIYFHLIAKDPLVQFFEPHSQIPVINLQQGPNESICDAVQRVRWEDIGAKVSRTRTLDGRMVIIAKGVISPAPTPIPSLFIHGASGQDIRDESFTQPTDKRFFVYIERFTPRDYVRGRKLTLQQQSRFAAIEEYFHAICLPFRGNSFSTEFQHRFSPSIESSLQEASLIVETNCVSVCSGSISGTTAFEILAQLQS